MPSGRTGSRPSACGPRTLLVSFKWRFTRDRSPGHVLPYPTPRCRANSRVLILHLQNGGFLISPSRCTQRSQCLCTKTLAQIQSVRLPYPPVHASNLQLGILLEYMWVSSQQSCRSHALNPTRNSIARTTRISASSSFSLKMCPRCLVCLRNSRLSRRSFPSKRSPKPPVKLLMRGVRSGESEFSL